MQTNNSKIAIYGGNGFVGARLAEKLHAAGARVICISRSGRCPEHLKNRAWAAQVGWIAGDAGEPDLQLLADQDVLITTVGSPPLPTFSQAAFDKQLMMNGGVNSALIKAAASTSIKRLVVVGAKIPGFLDREGFAYALGKQQSLQAARDFAASDNERKAIVAQPGGLYGTRYSKAGTAIPLGLVMGPLSKLLPSELVDVDQLAAALAHVALAKDESLASFTLLSHDDIRKQGK